MTTTAIEVRQILGLDLNTPTTEVVEAIRHAREIAAVVAEFDTGSDFDTLDPEGARLHARAMRSLREQGKPHPTEAEYMLAIADVEAA